MRTSNLRKTLVLVIVAIFLELLIVKVEVPRLLRRRVVALCVLLGLSVLLVNMVEVANLRLIDLLDFE